MNNSVFTVIHKFV